MLKKCSCAAGRCAVLICILISFTFGIGANVDKAYTKACKQNNIVKYEKFLLKYPHSPYSADVHNRIEELDYANIYVSENEAMKKQRLIGYLSKYRNGKYGDKVKSDLDILMFTEAKRSNTAQKWENYLKVSDNIELRTIAQTSLDSLLLPQRNASLIEACKNNNITEAKRLLDLGADPCTENSKKSTSLHYAASNRNAELTALLLARGANPNVFDSQNNSPLLYAVSYASLETCAVLLENGASLTEANGMELGVSCYNGYTDIVQLLLSKKADPTVKMKTGETALEQAIYGGYPEIVEMLLQAGANIDNRSNHFTIPLNAAVHFNDYATTCLLLKYGAQDTQDGLCLKTAKKNQNQAIERVLLDAAEGSFDFSQAMKAPEAQIPPSREYVGDARYLMYSTHTFVKIEGRKLTILGDDKTTNKTLRLSTFTKLKKLLPKDQQTQETIYTDAKPADFTPGMIVTISTPASNELSIIEMREGAITFGTDTGVQN
jgi:ankyrin repeat protein